MKCMKLAGRLHHASVFVRVGLLAGLLSIASGCGYSSSQAHFPEDVATVAVPIFGNTTFYRYVERDLTEALIKTIELRTPYKVVDRSRSDTLMEGVVVGVEQRQIIRTPEVGYPQEMEISLTIDWTWTDQRTGRIIRSRKGLQTVGRYIPRLGVDESIQVGHHEATNRMATHLVDAMRGEW